MTTSLKKLLLISITLLLGIMSGGVMAAAPSSVTYIGGIAGNDVNEYAYYNASTQTTTNYDLTTLNTSYDVNSAKLISQPWWGSDSSTAILFATAVGSRSGMPNVSGGYGPFFAYSTSSTDVVSAFYVSSGGGNVLTGPASTMSASVYYAQATLVGGAPEIDGSLAPKVGFLLGCLFLMFGRKKQNTEALLTA